MRRLSVVCVFLLYCTLVMGEKTYAEVSITRGSNGEPVYSIRTSSKALPVTLTTGAHGWYDASTLNTTGTLSF